MNSVSQNVTDLARARGAASQRARLDAVNPRLIHCRYADLTAGELSAIRSALAHVPGSDEGRAQLWEKFQRNHASMFIGRRVSGALAFFVFFEVRTHGQSSAREFFCGAAYSFAPDYPTLVEDGFPQLESFAARLACQSMTVRTSRPGLVAKLLKMPGYFLDQEANGQWIVRKRLGPDLSKL